MNPAHLMRQEAILTRRQQTGPPDVYGSPTWVESDLPVLCWTYKLSADDIEDRPAGRLTHRAFLPGDVVVNHKDRLTLATGQGWEVDGSAPPWVHPVTLQAVYVEADLVEVL